MSSPKWGTAPLDDETNIVPAGGVRYRSTERGHENSSEFEAVNLCVKIPSFRFHVGAVLGVIHSHHNALGFKSIPNRPNIFPRIVFEEPFGQRIDNFVDSVFGGLFGFKLFHCGDILNKLLAKVKPYSLMKSYFELGGERNM